MGTWSPVAETTEKVQHLCLTCGVNPVETAGGTCRPCQERGRHVPQYKSEARPEAPALPGRMELALRSLPRLSREILAVLMEDAQGYERARKKPYVMARVEARMGVAPGTLRDGEFREAKEKLVEFPFPDGTVIGSGPAGWYVCVTASDYNLAAKYLEDKGKDLLSKVMKIRAGRARRFGGPSLTG